MKGSRIAFAPAAVAVVSAAMAVVLAGPASAQVQSKDQQACLNSVVKTARKISGTVLKDAVLCIRKGAAGTLPMGETAAHCLVGDLKGKVAQSRTRLDAAALKSCATAPDFGFLDAPTAADSYVVGNEALLEDAFEEDLDATLAASHAVDPAGRCSAALPASWRTLEDAMHRAVEACLKDGLRAGTVVSNVTFEACLDSIVADTRGRVAKSVALVESQLLSKCPGGNLDAIFPGLTSICVAYGAGTDAAGLAACSEDRLECRICRIFNFAYGLDRNCDQFDDSLANGSCPDCGNTVIDTGEDCDDGNEVGGDGCTALCVDEFCGDGVINDNGAEVCDDGAGNSNTTPDACRLDCQEPSCGDGITDPEDGEECDDANTDENDGCTSQCTACGNGNTAGAEQCDDGNTVAGDCCTPSCTFEALGSSCTGAPSSDCTAPGCDGAGSCVELPVPDGGPCDDGDECSTASECQSGLCAGKTYVATGTACRWAVVGNPTDGTGGERLLYLEQSSTSTGDWCGDFGRFGDATVMVGDIVTMEGDSLTPGAELDFSANVDAGDVVTNNARVDGLAGEFLPGGVGTTTIAAGQVVAKTPAPTSYDTTGTDPRVSDCATAQVAISTSTAPLLDALGADADLGATLTSVAGGSTHTINAVNPGAVNVIDVDNISGGTNVTLNIDGGGSADTVIILRVQNALNTNVGWQWNLHNGLTADHFLIYGKGSGLSKCEIGLDNSGGGTIFCPDARVKIVAGTEWSGALLGGGSTTFAINIGENVVFTHQRFTGL